MADDVAPDWPKEAIVDDQFLFMRVHRNALGEDGLPLPGAFRNLPTPSDGMSTDWAKYSTPTQTRERARKPADNLVIKLLVSAVRGIGGQTVEHTPSIEFNNRAHTDVFGEKTTEARVQFLRIYEVALQINEAE